MPAQAAPSPLLWWLSSKARGAGAWGGSGSEAYQAVQARWDATSAELNTSLRELANRISEAGANMQSTEKGVGNLFGG